MMVPRSLHRCIDCAAPLFVVHDAVPPACLLPEECSAHGFPGETPRETRRLSSSSSSSPAASGTSVSQIALGMPAAFSVAANSEDRNEGGDSVKVPPHAPQLTSASSGVPTPHAEPRDTAQVQTPEAVSGFSRAPVSLSSPRAPSGESASSPSLQDSFVLLSPLPGTLAPAVGHREEAVSASSPVAATAHSADGSVGPSAFSQALAPEGLSRHSSEETHRQRFVARLAEGENWTQFVLDDAALCSKCFSSAVDQLEKQLEDERALLRQYTRALERLKKLRRAEAARRCRQERRERVDKGQALSQLDSRGGRKGKETNTAEAPSTRGNDCGSSCVQEDERTALDTTEQSPLRGDQGDHEQVGRNDTPQEGRLRLVEDLRTAQQEYEEAEDEEERLLEELLSLNLLQRELWHLSSARQGQIARHEEATAAMLRQREYVSGQLERLKRLNVMNDAFHIWTDSALPSINSCRIGRVSSPATPSWAEINSGWGHMCLLLDVLFRKVYVHPTHYRLVPRGPFSCLIRRKDDIVLPLQGGGKETGLSRFFYRNRHFDEATVAFLECVQELHEALVHFARQPWPPYASPGVQTPWEPPDLPFAIEGDRVGGLSIRLHLSQDERWTKAVKYLLIDLKWLLSYVEKVCVVCPPAS
ncbi:autophagy protein Apg6 [Toxoplasma gondii RUB]|uniref:Autophagy protein Apg6 n=1 Tax=Toxoplasma gondii RUB TaxID=935652 RepID=A0A086LWP4_TOXGO|nr:autophagy protein Apg6 [Toxoplasma gondii RUB]